MSFAIGAVLLVVGLLAAAVVVVGVPLFFGVVIWDLIDQRVERTPSVAAESDFRIAAERGVARAFVVLGGAFWSVVFFTGMYSFNDRAMSYALMAAGIPIVACAITLIVGWYYERFTALLLAAATVAVLAWGVIYQFELGVWMILTFTLIGPMATAAVLFWLARRDQEAYERVTAVQPDLAFVLSARSSLQ